MRPTLRLFSQLASLLLLAALSAACATNPAGTWDPIPSPPWSSIHPPPPPLAEHDLIPAGRLDTGCSHTFVGTFVDAPFAALVLAALGFMALHRRRARAEAALDREAPKAAGPVLITGIVEPDPADTDAPVEVQICQQGREVCNKGTWSFYWSEVRREVRARPFHVRRDDGTILRVEPDERRVALKDTLSRIVPQSRSMRIRVAELSAGDRVYITGALRSSGRAPLSPYRGDEAGPTLVAPPFGAMLISTERPGDTEAKRARFHQRWAIGLALGFAAVNALVIPTYRVLSLDGAPVQAEPIATTHWQVWVKPKSSAGHYEQHWAIRAELRAPGATTAQLEEETAKPLYDEAVHGWKAPFFVAEHAPWLYQVGVGATLSILRLVTLIVVMSVLLIVYPVSVVSTRPWYARRKVNDSGAGRLADATEKTGVT